MSPLHHIQLLERYLETRGGSLRRHALPERIHARLVHDQIILDCSLSPEDELAALIHELAHWLMHREMPHPVSRTLLEYEAEAVERLVLAHLASNSGSTAPGSSSAGAVTENLLLASVGRVTAATARLCDVLGVQDALGMPGEARPSEAQAPVQFETASREEIVLEYERYGMGDFLGLPEAL